MTKTPIRGLQKLGFPWQTQDPFLFCVHHDDAYPAGNERMGPAVSLEGRDIGQDFAGKDGFRMYHGQIVPGFPQHPHRGFETVTVARKGYIDHADSLGATARYGGGDVQWMTAGRGIVHAEMFPLLDRAAPNPAELFQIWLNLPAEDKFVPPHFSMFWSEDIPVRTIRDASGRETVLTITAGTYGDLEAPPPPPKSWGARPESDLAIWTLKLAPHAEFVLPAAQATSKRSLYFFRGTQLEIAGQAVPPQHMIDLQADSEVILKNGPAESELLLLQGRPIGQPVVQYGPFVMNSREEIQRAFEDYRATQFGGWPWPSDDPVHVREAGRFAKHGDGRVERR